MSTEDLDRLAEVVWNESDLGRYLYEPCMMLELPTIGIKRGISAEADWTGHLRRGLLACNQQLFEEFAFKSPLRCMVLGLSLESYFEQFTDDNLPILLSENRFKFLRDLLGHIRRHTNKRAKDQIVASCLSESGDKLRREPLRLLIHLVPEETIREHFSHITSLDLSSEMFCDRVLPKLGAFANLQELKLACSDVQEQDLRALAALPQLTLLDLSATRIGNFGLELLVNCRPLKVLRLSNCLMDDGAVHFLRQMKDRLDSVTISRQSVSEATVHELEQLLPKIVWLGKHDSSLQLD